MTNTSFDELGLDPSLLRAVKALGFETPSPIQAMAIPAILEGSDIIGLSATGSGKTAAFVLPMLQKIDVRLRDPQGIVLCPTRELAVQVCEDVHRLGSETTNLRAVPVYGGAPIDRQIRLLERGAHLVVGTPGRLLDHLRRKSLDLSKTKIAILDEADRMLDMGFKDEMDALLEQLPKERQMLFFSATMNRAVENLTKKFGNDPKMLKVERKSVTVESVEQQCYEVRHRSKVEVLSRLLDMRQPRLAIVFCNTKRAVDDCTEALAARGYAADRLHGDITQQMRERTLRRFRDGAVELLVATDVAARGLDIDEVDAVFNYDLPQDPEDYVHRIGRTGRAGRSGWAASFVFGRDVYRIQSIERYIKQDIPRARIPTQEQVAGKQADQLFDGVRERLESGDFEPHEEFVDRLLGQGYAATEISSVLFTLLSEAFGREGEAIVEDKQRERGEKRPRGKDKKPERREREPRGGRERGDRGEKRTDRGDKRPADGAAAGQGGYATLYLNVGTKTGGRPGDIAGMIYRESGVPDGSLGRIVLFPKHALVNVKTAYAEEVIKTVRDAKYRGKPVLIDHDRSERKR